ncbi:SMC5-SMC6 complex localization factor protein 1 [Patella vulgata]|uniref:SMC5-SMC6 complex localization factor protein 1 n=1 Tax=Patella vulgata TaxID=6465 RepID=UPI0021807411|nr:SMC5-SMC6 complex localization factor protein 1 [Patella vulgata]
MMMTKRTRHQLNPNRIFLLSGFSNEKRQDLAKKIRALGGVYFDIEFFKSNSTHIICGKLSRSEKFLGACATGKWILKANYIEDSYLKKQWLQEELFEWTTEDGSSPELKELASAPRRWRESYIINNEKSFDGFKAALLVEGNKRKTVYKRLLSCGGASVFNLQLPVTKPEKISNVLQYIFADRVLAAKHIPDSILDYGIMCLSPEYIGDFLIKETTPDPFHYLVVGPNVVSMTTDRNKMGDESICFTQQSNSTGTNSPKSTISNSISSLSPFSSQFSVKSDSPSKPTQKKTKAAKVNQRIITPTISTRPRKKIVTPVGQCSLNVFGFVSVKKCKIEPISSASPDSVGKDKEDIKPCSLHSHSTSSLQQALLDNKLPVQKRLVFTSDSVDTSNHGEENSNIMKKDCETPSILEISSSSTSLKRKLIIDDGPDRKKPKYGPTLSRWRPKSLLSKCQPSSFNGDQDISCKELPMSMTNIIDMCIEDEQYMSSLNLISSSISTTCCLKSTTLYSMMKCILLESTSSQITNMAYTTLMNHLLLHPPVTHHLQTIYSQSFQPDQSTDENTEKILWNFISSVMQSALIELTNEDEELFNNLVLLKYILAVFEVNFKHFINSIENGESGKMSHRSCLFIQYLWSPGFLIFTNRQTRDLLQYFEDCLTIPRSIPQKFQLLEILTAFFTLACQCFKLVESNWSASAILDPLVGNRTQSFITELSQRILNSCIEEDGLFETILQSMKPSWICLGVSAHLLSKYDDYLLLEGVEQTPITLSKIVTQYFFLLPRLHFNKPVEPLQEKNIACRARRSVITSPLKKEENIITSKVNHKSTHINTDKETVKPDPRLLQRINKKNYKGETPLHVACIKNDVRRLKQLLAVPGINVNAADNYGWSPLHEACNHGNIECAELLLKYSPMKTVDSYFSPGSEKYRKVDLLLCNVDGITALHDAVDCGWTDICQLLIKHGGNRILEVKTKSGKLPVDFAQTEELRKLLSPNNETGSCSQDSVTSIDSRLDWLPTDYLYQEILNNGNNTRVTTVKDCVKFISLIQFLTTSYIATHRLQLLHETLKLHTYTSSTMPSSPVVRRALQHKNQRGDERFIQWLDGNSVMKILNLTEDQLKRGHKDLKTLLKIKKYLVLFEKHLKLIMTEEDFKAVKPKVNFLICSLATIL